MNNINNSASAMMELNHAGLKYVAAAYGLKPQDIKTNYTPVVDMENRRIYLCIKDAALAIGVTAEAISNNCRRKFNTRWYFANEIGNTILKQISIEQRSSSISEIGMCASEGMTTTHYKGAELKSKKIRIDPVRRYKANTTETFGYQDKDAAELYARIFKIGVSDVPKWCAKCTIMLDTGCISPVESHFTRPDDNIKDDKARLAEYTKEIRWIRRSCKNYSMVNAGVNPDGTTPLYNGHRFAYVSELPISVVKNILKEMETIGCKDYVAYNNYKMNHPTNYDICLGRVSKVKDNYSRAEMQIAWSEIERLKKQNKELFDKLGRSAKC